MNKEYLDIDIRQEDEHKYLIMSKRGRHTLFAAKVNPSGEVELTPGIVSVFDYELREVLDFIETLT